MSIQARLMERCGSVFRLGIHGRRRCDECLDKFFVAVGTCSHKWCRAIGPPSLYSCVGSKQSLYNGCVRVFCCDKERRGSVLAWLIDVGLGLNESGRDPAATKLASYKKRRGSIHLLRLQLCTRLYEHPDHRVVTICARNNERRHFAMALCPLHRSLALNKHADNA